ncbi:hypothetical protein EHS25_006353 [Saitozyma podzolica]|uniref:Uncharacterized protein n=1 Tax=Saitozyma podzolica TaxID=1890683 RepID=A0A427YRR0_9TREE|nr:hypothetical protein EHS25_006353 [Saitozyma podzolica]
MWSKLAVVVGLVASSLVSAAPTEQLTNAERIQRGLPLNRPVRHFDASRTRALLPRSSDSGTEQSVVQFTPPLGKRNVDQTKYLSYDGTNLGLVLDVSDALIVNLPTTNTLIDGQIVATYNGQDLYMSSYHPTTAQEGVFMFTLTSTSDNNAPAGQDHQTSIWNYVPDVSLAPDYFPATGNAKSLTFGLDANGNFIGATSDVAATAIQTSLIASTASYADVVAANPPPPTPYLMTIDYSSLTPNPQYIQYTEGPGGLGSFGFVTDTSTATTFTVAASTTNSSLSVISFTYNGVAKKMATRYYLPGYCGAPCPKTFDICATPSGYDTFSTGGAPETDVWYLNSPIEGGIIGGMSGIYTYTDGRIDSVILTANNELSGRDLKSAPYSSGISADGPKVNLVPVPP